jgi:hypothetical protein
MQNEEKLEGETMQNTEVVVEETNTATEDTIDWKAEALKQKAINERISKRVSKPSITKTDESPREQLKPSDILRADEFKLYRQGYTETEIDLIMKNGGMDALKDEKSPLVLGLKVAKEQRQAEEASSRAQDTSGTSELERKYTKTEIANMDTKKLEEVIGFAQ